MPAPLADITGQQFGRLVAVEPTGKKRYDRAVWLCRCDPRLGGCGQTAEVSISALRKGDTRSCGCLRKETGAANLAAGRARKNTR